MASLRDEFNRDDPNAVGGCYFHWKQALRRRLKELKIPKELITKLMGHEGLVNILAVFSYDEVPKGIEYIRYKMSEGEYKSSFDKFWSYFMKTWMKKLHGMMINLVFTFSTLGICSILLVLVVFLQRMKMAMMSL